MPSEITYDDWLALSEEAQDELKHSWDAYSHEMFWVPMMAAVRLANQCGNPVSDLYAGIYHGGEYVLHLTVAPEVFVHCPKPLVQRFEGFRVVWFQKFPAEAEQERLPFGTWESKGCLGDFRIEVFRSGPELKVSCRLLTMNLPLPVVDIRTAGDSITFITREPSRVLRHILSHPKGNELNHHVTIGQFADRTTDA
jgi:hypothetical protein